MSRACMTNAERDADDGARARLERLRSLGSTGSLGSTATAAETKSRRLRVSKEDLQVADATAALVILLLILLLIPTDAALVIPGGCACRKRTCRLANNLYAVQGTRK